MRGFSGGSVYTPVQITRISLNLNHAFHMMCNLDHFPEKSILHVFLGHIAYGQHKDAACSVATRVVAWSVCLSVCPAAGLLDTSVIHANNLNRSSCGLVCEPA